MKIGLYDVDSKIPNLALMKLSAYHKQRGDDVEFYSPLFHESYDVIHASKVFSFTNVAYVREGMNKGGSGWDLKTTLPPEIEHVYPDYDLYECDHAMGFLTRGCIRNCPWCIVPEKEGMIRLHSPLNEFVKDQEKIMLLDNNILAHPAHLNLLRILRDTGKRIDINQGLDIRLINDENATLLREIKRWDGLRYRFALDDPALIPLVEKKLTLLNEAGISNGTIQFYVLIGFNTTMDQDLKRVNFLKEKGCAVFIMPYNKFTVYEKHFTRWVNRFFYKYQTFEEYLGGAA